MASNPWFRLHAEFAGDPVVQCLAFEDQRHFVILLCLKCDGTLDRPVDPKVRDRIIARGLGLDTTTALEARRRLAEVGLIDPKTWQPKKWNERQYRSDNSTPRTRKYRKRKETGNVPETSRERPCDGPETEADLLTESSTDSTPARATASGAQTRPPPQWKGDATGASVFVVDGHRVLLPVNRGEVYFAQLADWLGCSITGKSTRQVDEILRRKLQARQRAAA